MVSVWNIIIIPYLSSPSITLGAIGVLDPDSLSPFGHVGEVELFSIKSLVGVSTLRFRVL